MLGISGGEVNAGENWCEVSSEAGKVVEYVCVCVCACVRVCTSTPTRAYTVVTELSKRRTLLQYFVRLSLRPLPKCKTMVY
jgi:hypothetical protein